MSLYNSQSGNNSLNNNNNNNNEEEKSNKQLNNYAKDLKKYFLSLKSEKEISKILKKNKYNMRPEEEAPKSKQNIKSFFKKKTQDNLQLSTPIEFLEQIQDFEKETKKKIEKQKEKEIKKQIEVEKIKEEIIKEKKRKERLDSNKKKYDNFWKKVKYYIDKKNEHLSEITYKLKLRNATQDKKNYSLVKMNKTSIQLYPKSRKPLYRHKNINERLLNKELSFFYSYCQKERRDSKSPLSKSQRNLNHFKEEKNKKCNSANKYQNFYGNKINWLKKKEDKNELRRKYLDNVNRKSFSFRPNIDKKSIKLVKQRNTFLNFLENKFNTDKDLEKTTINKTEIYQKYLVTIKPYMNFYFERNSPFFKRYKKNFVTPNKSSKSINIGMIHINKGNNIRIIKEKTSKKEEKSKEKDRNNIQIKKNIFNIFKPEKRINKNNKEKENNKDNKDRKSKLWWNEVNHINDKKDKKKKIINGLYKVNVRENCSWNKICENKIIPKKIKTELLNDFF